MDRHNETEIVAEPGKQEMFLTREFDAPRELVFRAFVDPQLYPQWMGPRNLAMELETFEPREGGRWRYVHKDSSGRQYAFRGVFHEVVAPERITSTFEFEGLPEHGHAVLETTRFEVLPGDRTRMTAHMIFQSIADRDGQLQAGLEDGARQSYERLDELLHRIMVT